MKRVNLFPLLALVVSVLVTGSCSKKARCKTDEDCKNPNTACINGHCVSLDRRTGAMADQPEPTRNPDPSVTYRVPVDPKKVPILGPNNALVTVAEFSDFQCPFCRRAAGTMHELLKLYPKDVRLVFFHNPLPFHKHAQKAAEAAMAVFVTKGNEAFWKYHDLLFDNQRNLDVDGLVEMAKKVGADPKKIRDALEKGTYADRVAEQKRMAARLGARGTPAFFINGRFLSGAQPLGRFKQLVEEEFKKAKKLMDSKKIPASKVYEAIMKSAKEAP